MSGRRFSVIALICCASISVVVEHVTVASGGQAIVGTVVCPGGVW
jgi:hypothetical protein